MDDCMIQCICTSDLFKLSSTCKVCELILPLRLSCSNIFRRHERQNRMSERSTGILIVSLLLACVVAAEKLFIYEVDKRNTKYYYRIIHVTVHERMFMYYTCTRTCTTSSYTCTGYVYEILRQCILEFIPYMYMIVLLLHVHLHVLVCDATK